MNRIKGFSWLNKEGDFSLDNPQNTSYLYFPVANEAGLMGAVTPTLNGDLKSSQNTFLLEPVSAENLHNNRSSRNFWLNADGIGAWSCTGVSARQLAEAYDGTETSRVEAGFLWHKLIRENPTLGIRAEITTFAPMTADQVELTRITVTNTGFEPLTLTPTAAFPLYARSASDIRDHRHVTSLLHRIRTTRTGLEVKPSFSFDERGHKINHVTYGAYAAEGGGTAPVGFFPQVEDYIGEGGTYDWPETVVKNLPPLADAGETLEGFEAVGAIRFADTRLVSGASKTWIAALVISEEGCDTEAIAGPYLSETAFVKHLEASKAAWREKLGVISFGSADEGFDQWMKWVSLQPILRRIYGCSFLPHHDYGRGGRGWRDLWQDCLALLVMEPAEVKNLLFNNFAGVRVDGSNATIIGTKPGEFIADRNNIARSWMDHGAWPFMTTMLYLNQTGDLGFLTQNQTYFKDKLVRRSKAADESWTPAYGNKQRQANGDLHEGTILEHLLLQNVVQFFNVGDHNNLRLEDADWNDGLDMAGLKGESVAFSSFYAANLQELADLLKVMQERDLLTEVAVAEEMDILFDTIEASDRLFDDMASSNEGILAAPGMKAAASSPVDYESVTAKQTTLNTYYRRVLHDVSGKKIHLPVSAVIADLEAKSAWLMEHIRRNEIVRNEEGFEWFNGYYDNGGRRVEGDFPTGVRMTLTGQVFPIMGGTATVEQVGRTVKSVNRYLKDPKIGGYRLNSNFHEVKLDMGRCFGFAFGHKENGAMFSHMAIMYGNALYKRGFIQEGFDVLSSLYTLCNDFEKARIYPGIPEYINEKRRGMYHYLTGSASWLLLTVLTEVFGVRGRLGDLALEPKLVRSQFDANGQAKVHTLFAEKELDVIFTNAKGLDVGEYSPTQLSLDGVPVPFRKDGHAALLERSLITSLGEGSHELNVTLG